MTFDIRLGVPGVENFWNELKSKIRSGDANKDEIKLYKRIKKTLILLQNNPAHNSLHTHQNSVLSNIIKRKVWCSYIKNKTPRAERLYWVYGPNQNEITVVGIEKHPDDTNHAYMSIDLSWPKTQ